MHWQQQECSSYSSVLQILHSFTEANHLYGNMCRHIHISSIPSCLYCHALSSLSFLSDINLHEDDILSVLQLVQYIEYFIIFSLCMYEVMFAYLSSSSFFSYLFICHLLICNISVFSTSTFSFFEKILAKSYT